MQTTTIHMLLFAASLSNLISGTIAQGSYEQCGGKDWTGGTSCQPGWKCTYQNDYYSQCLPVDGSNQGSGIQGAYAQCGGKGWTGGTKCQTGWVCVYQNEYYSQCLMAPGPSTSSTTKPSTTMTTTVKTTPQPTTAVTQTTTRSTSSKVSASTSPANSGTVGPTYKASMTWYGSGDTFGSPNCNTNTAACFFYTQPGFSAAVSENLYGAPPGAGVGPACGTCWRLTGQTDSNGNKLKNAGTNIVIMVNNLCPRQGNPLCSQSDLSSTNQYGANVNFDLCSDSGARDAFFGNSDVGLAVGTAVQVDCSQWTGTKRT